jgi:hypothetical protein
MKRPVKKIPNTFRPPMIGDSNPRGNVRPGPTKPEEGALEQLAMMSEEDLANMSSRDLISLALRAGVDARELVAVKGCQDHSKRFRWKQVDDNALQGKVLRSREGMGIDYIWCRSCGHWFLMVMET